MSNEYTTKEVKDIFLKYIFRLIDQVDAKPELSSRDKLKRFAFDLLSTIDGTNRHIPGFIVAPRPHPEDKQFHIDRQENYFPENHEIEDKIKADIAGNLHDDFFDYENK